MTKAIDTKDIFQLLDYIVKGKAGVFILERKLDLLYSWISGYHIGSEQDSYIKNVDQLDDFSKFVQKMNHDEFGNTFGWFGSIRAIYGGDIEGFEKFCELYQEFRKEKNKY
ncbi:hypothetical protein FUAX_44830 (plasmid) [Fulvitalea axinellae]|uniref:Uncharacterized protein n=1 Tax=Fulvitalea axinellae TaxID=1182444 RepID=A0AAU9CIV7_9BACT|nr:hypothetical protein FUAX_44830 [Fulvitalea axinellae]